MSHLHFVLPDVNWVELIARGVAVYVFLIVVLRIAGRREMGQLSSFDLVLLLILSNAVQNSINAGDNSLGGGMISALTLIVLNGFVAYAAYKSRWFDRLIQGRPVRIVTDGKVHVKAIERERITLSELKSALRKQGIMSITECRRVILEPDGTLSAQRRDETDKGLAELAHPDPVHVGEKDDPAAYGAF